VVGQEVIRYLEAHKANSGIEPEILANRDFAKRCLNMLVQDDDGHWILHYLGYEFRSSVTYEHHNPLYEKAKNFVIQQLEEHRQLRNTKLAFRYSQLLAYFEAHTPSA
jgi:hypothetical protein